MNHYKILMTPGVNRSHQWHQRREMCSEECRVLQGYNVADLAEGKGVKTI